MFTHLTFKSNCRHSESCSLSAIVVLKQNNTKPKKQGAYVHYVCTKGHSSPSRLSPWLTPDRSIHRGAESVSLQLICYVVPCCASHSGRLLLMSQRCTLSLLPPLPSLRREIAPSGPCRVLQSGHNRPETYVCLTVGRVWSKSGTRLWASHWLTFKPDTKAWMPLNNGMFMQV